jgi:hypothetical protein
LASDKHRSGKYRERIGGDLRQAVETPRKVTAKTQATAPKGLGDLWCPLLNQHSDWVLDQRLEGLQQSRTDHAVDHAVVA